MANTEGIPRLFATVATAAASPRYPSLPPPPEGSRLGERPALGGNADAPPPVR